MKKQSMYNLIYNLRKFSGVKIDTLNRIIYYEYQKDEELMQYKKIIKLCKFFGFNRQAEIRK